MPKSIKKKKYIEILSFTYQVRPKLIKCRRVKWDAALCYPAREGNLAVSNTEGMEGGWKN
jgi:hypothetical protein